MAVELVSREMEAGRSLMHYRKGGEKKGVRRYQYKDGSYTPEGYKHYAEMYGWGKKKESTGKQEDMDPKQAKRVEESSKFGYLNPTREDRKKGLTKNRDEIAKKYTDEYWVGVKKGTVAENEWTEHGQELWDKYKDAYAEATLKDLGIPVTEKNKSYVKDTFEKYDSHYDYSIPNTPDGEKRRLDIEIAWNDRFGEKQNKSLLGKVKDKIEKQHEKNTPETRKEARETDKETEKKAEAAINSFNEKIQAKKAERAKESQSLQERIRAISKMTDAELNAGITRLQKEKQLSELINEQNAREKGPVHEFANQLFKKAVNDLSNQAMDLVVKKITNKLAVKAGLRAQDNNNRNNSDTTNNSGGGTTLSKGQKSQVRSLAASGKSVAELAKQFNVSESYINQLISGGGS